jgi:uncharacterized membrane protein
MDAVHNKYMLSPKEMFVKTLILRIVSSFITMFFVYFFTGSWHISFSIMGLDFVVKTFVYYGFELYWFKMRRLWS